MDYYFYRVNKSMTLSQGCACHYIVLIKSQLCFKENCSSKAVEEKQRVVNKLMTVDEYKHKRRAEALEVQVQE